MTIEIANKSPEAKSAGVTSQEENTDILTGFEWSNSSRYIYKSGHFMMLEQNPS